MKSEPYNRTHEKNLVKELISKPSEKLKNYQVCYYTDEISGEWICTDEMFFSPDKEELVKGYIGDKNFKVFANYENGFQEEL